MALGLLIGVAGAAARVYGPARSAAVGRDLCRGHPQHAAAGAALPRLLRPAEPRHPARRHDRGDHRAHRSISAPIRPRSSAPGCEAIPSAQIEAGHSLGLSRLQVFRYIVLFPALKVMYPGARQPVRPADARDQRRLADLGAGPVPRRLDHPVAHLPRLRGLHRDRRALSRAGAGLPRLAFAGIYQLGVRADDDPRVRLHRRDLPDRGGALDAGADRRRLRSAAACVGLLVALLRVDAARAAALARHHLHPGRAGHAAARLAVRVLLRPADLRARRSTPGSRRRPPSRSMPAPSSARSGAARCRRSRARNGRPAPRSASASSSSCATSSCRRRSGSRSRRRSASWSSSSRTPRSPPTIGFVELTREGQLTTAVTFQPFTVYHHRRGALFRACASR